jgi:glucose-6-phosphate 1-dehydrogenase
VSATGFTRLIVEKPFGHDLDSAVELATNLGAIFPEVCGDVVVVIENVLS